eukprot:scaffold2194_cov130-Cylindrotheca_fusiformis.AAC.2
MKISIFPSLVAVAAVVACVMGDQVAHEKEFSSELQVLSPTWMEGTLDHRGALFGSFPAGESIHAELFYTTRQLCGNETPGTPENIQTINYFLLVNRGGCSFVEKVRNAQRDNATAVIIADTHCVCGDNNTCVDNSTQECEDVVPVLDDDGTGGDVIIPSFMIYKPDGDLLKEQLVRGTDVEMTISWPMPQATNGRTEFVLWTTPDDIMSYQFLTTFASAAKEMYDKVIFKPKMFIKDGTEKGCRKFDTGDDPCPGFCTNYGRYCPSRLYDFEQYENKGIKMVVESLRRICIWDVYGEGGGVGKEWWMYMEAWIHKCSSGSHYSTECAEAAYEAAGIDPSLIDQCMEQSGNFRTNTENVLLANMIAEAEEFDVTFAPALYVNEAVVRGALTYGSAMNAICATFDPSVAPSLCAQWDTCKKDCPTGKNCFIDNSQCRVYEPPFVETGTDYDDDYITTEQTAAPTAAQTATQTAPLTAAPTAVRFTPSPTAQPGTQKPTNLPTDPETSSPTTLAPSRTPQIPVAYPQPTPKVKSGSETVNETVQIYEGRNGPDSGLVIGLSVGFGLAFFCSILVFLFIRDRRRQIEMCQIAMDDGRGLVVDKFRDESSQQGSRLSWKSRRPRMPRFSRNLHDLDDEYETSSRSRGRGFRRFLRRPRFPRRHTRYEPRPPIRSSSEEEWDDDSTEGTGFDSVELMRGDYGVDIIDRERSPIAREPRSRHYPREFVMDDDSLEDEYE